MSATLDLAADQAMACRQVALLTGSADTPVHVRLIHDSDKHLSATKLHGTIADLWPTILRAQAVGYGVFMVVNAGGDCDEDIHHVHAVFIDADGNLPQEWDWHV